MTLPMTMAEANDVYRYALDLLYDQGWTKGSWHAKTGGMCVEGLLAASLLARGIPPERGWPVLKFARRCVNERGHRTIRSWNDAAGRTVDDVVELLDYCVAATTPPAAAPSALPAPAALPEPVAVAESVDYDALLAQMTVPVTSTNDQARPRHSPRRQGALARSCRVPHDA